VVCAGAPLTLMCGKANRVPAAGLILDAASLGFLPWNWPPAKIFIGDVGSGYLRYVIAVLVCRVMRGDRIHQAHRSHADQWAARRWGSHRRVIVAVMVLNVMWLLSCASLATEHPDYAVQSLSSPLIPLSP
jgi:Fuc2NAc and GlcNAc transferase